MKHFFLFFLVCSWSALYGQSTIVRSIDADVEIEESAEAINVEESVESELTDSDEAGIPLMFTMTSGPVESAGRILLSSNDGKMGSVPIVVEPKQELDAVPATFALYQNYPNPFNPTTTLEFDLPKQSIVTLKLYNTIGQEVATLIQSELMDEGSQEVEFDASGLPSGVYFYRLVANQVSPNDDEAKTISHTSVKKLLLLR